MIILGIDPGPEESAFVVWDGKTILDKGIEDNGKIIGLMKIGMFYPSAIMAIEGIQSYGGVVGAETFKTCIVIGRLLEAAKIPIEKQNNHLVYRPAIKGWLCGSARSKDKDVRQALINMLGKEATHGISSHLWSALAVAVYYYQNFTTAANLKKREIN